MAPPAGQPVFDPVTQAGLPVVLAPPAGLAVVPVPPARQHVVVAPLAKAPLAKMPVVLAPPAGQPVNPIPKAWQPEVLAPLALVGLSVVLAPPAGQPVVWEPQAGQTVVPSSSGVVHITNSQKTNKLSPDSVCEAPRTHNNEVKAAQSPVLNNNQLPSNPRRQNKGII